MKKNVQGKTDLKRSGATEDREAKDISSPGDEFLKNEGLRAPKKQTITIRLDTDVLDWFRRQGKGYQTRINKLLRSYMEAHQK